MSENSVRHCKPLVEGDLQEFVGQIIDVFEDFLEAKNITIQNEEKTYDPDAAIIYGTDYDELQEDIISTLRNWGFVA